MLGLKKGSEASWYSTALESRWPSAAFRPHQVDDDARG